MSSSGVSTRHRWVRFRSPSWSIPDKVLPRLFRNAHHPDPEGAPFTDAACGGLKPPPAGRLRRAFLHLLHRTAFRFFLLEPPSAFRDHTAQLAHFQPEGGHAEVEPGDNPYARQFPAIRGIILEIEEVRAKFKFGGNKTVEHRIRIADWLASRPGELNAEARENLLRRIPD